MKEVKSQYVGIHDRDDEDSDSSDATLESMESLTTEDLVSPSESHNSDNPLE